MLGGCNECDAKHKNVIMHGVDMQEMNVMLAKTVFDDRCDAKDVR